MTKDLALAIHGSQMSRGHYLNTEEFINFLEQKLMAALQEHQSVLGLSKQ